MADYNSSNGTFGKWDPLNYRFLSQQGDERLDLTTAEWLKLNGTRVSAADLPRRREMEKHSNPCRWKRKMSRLRS